MQKYSFWQSLLKMVVKVGVFLLPLLIHFLPSGWLDLTIGGVLYMVLDWLQKKYTTV